MVLKFIGFFAIIALTTAGIIPSGDLFYAAPSSQPQAYRVIKPQHILTRETDDFDPHPQYKYGYDVEDTLSGDSKSQVETRDGDFVQGEYSLIDADGYKRTVQYTVDAAHGFNAVVSRVPANVKAVAATFPVKTVTPANVVDVPVPVRYTDRTAETSYDSDPVVKGAYAVTPIVKATPVAYP